MADLLLSNRRPFQMNAKCQSSRHKFSGRDLTHISSTKKLISDPLIQINLKAKSNITLN